jgi:hypothetical protein
MPDEIPLDKRNSAPLFRLPTYLGDDQVVLDFRWNSQANGRKGSWFMDVLDSNTKPIAQGVKLVLGVNLCRTSSHEIFTRNMLRLVDTSRKDREATLDDLGTRVVLLNFTLAELFP